MNVLYSFPQFEEASEAVGGPRKKRRGTIIFGIFLTLAVTILFIGWSDSASSDQGSGKSVHDVKSMIIETATHRPENTIHPNGGVLGSWWIYANESIGDSLIGLCLESKRSHIGASRAVIRIDVDDDTLSFILEDAVVAVLPDSGIEGSLERHDSLKIGPIPLTFDVVEDHAGDLSWRKPDASINSGQVASGS
tara:strand:- start:1932 stop:2510 length:579 start_codon:yes stop_codon:yes gene_type:complete